MKYLFSYFAFFWLFTSCGKSPLFSEMDNPTDHSQAKLSESSDDVVTWAQTGYSFGVEWYEGPYSLRKSSFRLRFWRQNGATIWGPYELVEPKLCVMLWMRMPDGSEHGNAPLTITPIASEQFSESNWIYHIDDAYFVMNGWWQIRVRLIEIEQQCGSLKSDPFIEEKILEVFID
jgi:hypothetical protein